MEFTAMLGEERARLAFVEVGGPVMRPYDEESYVSQPFGHFAPIEED